MYKNIIIITDDGIESNNTKKMFNILKYLLGYKNTFLVLNKEYIQSKSNSISLNPVKLLNSRIENLILLSGGYPADCLLYSIYKLNLEKNDTLFIFGINNHNHCGYMNYTGSTTCLLSLTKCFGYKAVSILCDELDLDNEFLKNLLEMIIKHTEKTDSYYAFNINEQKTFFHNSNISDESIDVYETIDTSRGKYILLSFNKCSENPVIGTDSYYQKEKLNYITKVF